MDIKIAPCWREARYYIREAQARARCYVPDNDHLIIHICCDASWKKLKGQSREKGGIAVIVTVYKYTPRCRTSDTKKTCFIASVGDNNECELIAILESLCVAVEQIRKHIGTSNSTTDVDLIIWSDAKSALNRLDCGNMSDNSFCRRTSNIYEPILQRTREIEAMGRSTEVRFRWIKGESVREHDMADYWSKRVIDREDGSASVAVAALCDAARKKKESRYQGTKRLPASRLDGVDPAGKGPESSAATGPRDRVPDFPPVPARLPIRSLYSTRSSGQPSMPGKKTTAKRHREHAEDDNDINASRIGRPVFVVAQVTPKDDGDAEANVLQGSPLAPASTCTESRYSTLSCADSNRSKTRDQVVANSSVAKSMPNS